MSKSFLFIFCTCLMSLFQPTSKVDIEVSKLEVIHAEKAFETMLTKDGMAKAFIHFAADGAVLQRGNRLVKGKSEIQERFGKVAGIDNMKLKWEPDFVDVSSSGDLRDLSVCSLKWRFVCLRLG
jgi:hypothetical protein